ncbi:zinc finger HIT domain-containing protein 1-like [Branchiostoma lanceolatum]
MMSSKMADKKARESGRLRDADKRRVIDNITRLKRQRRQIENLERDNFHDDPHANLVLVNKKLPQFSDTNDSPATKKKKKTRGDHFKQRFRKNFQTLLEEEQLSIRGGPNYLTAQVPPSEYPERKFCAVCGFPSNYTCVTCGARYCCVRCLGTHQDTRCLKWTV